MRGSRHHKSLEWSGIRAGMLVLVSALLSWATPPGVWAAVFQIPAGDVPELIAAIQAANANGEENTISLETGTYTLIALDNITDGPNGLPSITSTLTITGAGADTTVVERAASAPAFRLMHVAATATVTLEAFTLQGGRLDELSLSGGGGILNRGTLAMTHSVLRRNIDFRRGAGGGLANVGGTVILTYSAIEGNSADAFTTVPDSIGGGLANMGGMVTLTHSTIAGNGSRGSGGGLFNEDGTVTLTNSTVARNVSFQGGVGAGLANYGGTVTLTNSTVTDNRAEGDLNAQGGGLWSSGTVTLVNSTVAHNRALGFGERAVGGGLSNGGTLTLINSTVAHNRAITTFSGRGGAGGGLANSGTMTLINSTVADNSASGPIGPSVAGGGIAGPAILQNTIVARNTVADPGARGPDCFSVITSLDHNLIGDPTDCAITLLPSDLTGDPSLGDFVDPGAPGQGRFPLLPSSPAIDAGDDAACPPTDQLDTPRRGPCDIGAIEFYPLVNDLVALGQVSTAFDPTAVPGRPAGIFHITAEFTNTGPQAISHPFAEVVDLTGGNRLLNAEGGPAGVGALLRPAESASTPLAPGTAAIFEFIIGLQTLDPFTFLVDLLGDPQAAELAQRSRGAGQWPVW